MKFKNVKKILIFKKWIIEYIQIIIGTIIMAIGISLFLLPNQLSSGGFTGVATITYYFFNWKMGTVIILLNAPLFIIAFFKIGKEFLIKAISGTLLLSVFIDYFTKFKPITNDRFLACIYGGIIIGLGTALILRVNASTGGTELLTSIIKRYNSYITVSNLIVVFDVIIVFLNIIFFREIEIGLYSAISIYLMGKLLDIFFEGIYFTKMIIIISNKSQEISNSINNKLKRGTTGIYGKGMYKNENKMILLCVAQRREVIKIREIIKNIDNKAFIIISNSREVLGKGFKEDN